MNFGGFQLMTVLDYPGELSSILFTKGCNLKCPYCHNSSIASGSGSNISISDVLKKLISRKDKINHVVISGGEPSIHNELIQFMIRLKMEEFKIKIDTNGLNPDFINQILRLSLVDYIAMDIKTVLNSTEYEKVTGIPIKDSDISAIVDSINAIIQSNIKYEFRTTVVKDYHSIDTLKKIADMRLPIHFLQKFVNSDGVLDHSLESYNDDEMREIITELKKINPYMELRGV